MDENTAEYVYVIFEEADLDGIRSMAVYLTPEEAQEAYDKTVEAYQEDSFGVDGVALYKVPVGQKLCTFTLWLDHTVKITRKDKESW